ncbi:uncharacterized protein Ecym_7440 [Eremothecium cymbalariae DBVPG|uniref:Zn(2)-C6 fungal-type domain-containing protein n=1 Tax=Eremothecium cymbalariae (strain CBS 270.75 / DBVPG 7215 / KCTC 17166 / NRRL Y-17582) TaxID=931890 RepID=G8JWP5_ERECY|nr:hypothetical protein Ecym_7440 [Eremothecium cymbalariae DBVPG\
MTKGVHGQYMMPEKSMQLPRKRVSKACDTCRAKKIKCNGEEPCSNCGKHDLECAYTHVIKRRRPVPTRISNRKLLGDLSSRLQRLEQLLERVSSKLGAGAGRQGKECGVDGDAGDEGEKDGEEDEEGEEEDEEEDADVVSTSSVEVYGRPRFARVGSMSSQGSSSSESVVTQMSLPADGSYEDSKSQTYFGTHTSLSLFSRRGLRWLYKVLGGKSEVIIPLIKLNGFMRKSQDMFCSKFLLAVDLEELPAWPTVEQCEILCEVFINNFLWTFPVLTLEEVRAIFGRMRAATPEGLSITDKLLAGAVMLLAAAVNSFQVPSESKLWRSISSQMLRTTINIVQTTWMISMPDPVGYMQGIILMCIFLENSPVPQTTYLQLSFAIRLGQAQNLHHREPYLHIKDPVERQRRINVWWWCYRYDKTLSTSTGKPSLIHEHDNTAFNEWDFYQMLEWQLQQQPAVYELQPRPPPGVDWQSMFHKRLLFASSNSITSLNHALNYYFYKLYRIQSEAYIRVFGNKAQSSSTNIDCKKRIQNINYILDCLDCWRDSLPDLLKPRSGEAALAEVFSQLMAMRRKDEDTTMVNQVRPRILLLYVKYYHTASSVAHAAVRPPWILQQSLLETKKLVRKFPLVAHSIENSLSILHIVDYMLLHDTPSQLYLELLLAHFGSFLSIVGNTFLYDNVSYDNILLLDRCTKTVVSIAQRQTPISTWKWVIVAIVTTHFLKLTVDRYNEHLKTSPELPALPLNRNDYVLTLKSLQATMLSNYRKIFSSLDDLEKKTRQSNITIDDPLTAFNYTDWFNNDLNASSQSLLSTISPNEMDPSYLNDLLFPHNQQEHLVNQLPQQFNQQQPQQQQPIPNPQIPSFIDDVLSGPDQEPNLVNLENYFLTDPTLNLSSFYNQ